ncbi:MAG: class I SAM-dependent methyltransferase [Flavobacteriales bacterium]|jgi:SAM-dependent methyltransferase|nr:class I SAM-dependent methyltransferase [Flavobacteriales bacterium]MBT5090329.1 class I SAM-dependent methyltransferase [Flavobacteriales bacterium]MBT5750919.1 class I SAM-dependent methyltransferase [Flavobacteriales bacterium]
MSWFANWFDSFYYHTLYKNRNEKEAQFFIDNLIDYLQIPKGSKLIDIACGKGRHAKYFNQKGMDVVGIDLSPNSINTAKKDENKNLQFSVHDMRDNYQENTFDVVTNLFTSFGYFEDNKEEQKAINAMASNLKKEGILIIDFMNAKKVIADLVLNEQKTIDGIQFEIKRHVENGYILKDIRIIDRKEKQQFQEKVKAITLADYSEFTANAGLNIIDIFGNYKLDNFDEKISDRLILICKK